MFKKTMKNALSPIITTILLIFVVVVIVTVLLNWSKGFTHTNLTKVNNIDDFEKSDVVYYSNFNNSKNKNGLVYLRYEPPINQDEIDVNVIGFSLKEEDGEIPIVYLDEQIKLNPGDNYLKLGIIDTNFDLILYLDNNTFMTVDDLTMNYTAPPIEKCPVGYVSVPGNSLYGTNYVPYGGFCVMKYEAKVDTNNDGVGDIQITGQDSNYCRNKNGFALTYHNTWCHDMYHNGEEYVSCPTDCNIALYDVVSSAEGYPISGINNYAESKFDAKDACESLGSNYHLITNEEWMTLARNIERQSQNWSSGIVGLGKIKKGNLSTELENVSYNAGEIEYTIRTTSDETAKFILSNSSEIWDLSGNVWEWIDKNSTTASLPELATLGEGIYTGSSWTEYNGYYNSKYIYDNDGLKYSDFRSLNSDWNNDQGIGRIQTRSNSTDINIRSWMRGGYFFAGDFSGLYTLYLSSYPDDLGYYIGFRCVMIPTN